MFCTRISGPVAVIGDVHGQVDKLQVLLDQLEARRNFADLWLVFIGDLVDRGPDPRGVLDAVLALMQRHPRTSLVAGNHELAMAGALGLIPAPEHTNWARRWLSHYGAETTFASYGVPWGDLAALSRALPDAHRRLLTEAPWCVEHPELLCVHAGLDPQMPFRAQLAVLRQRDFTLANPGWLCSKEFPFEPPPADCDKLVISGHVPTPQVQIDKRRILVDTTGGVAGDLSCVLLPERRVVTSGGERAAPTGSLFGLAKLLGRRAAMF